MPNALKKAIRIMAYTHLDNERFVQFKEPHNGGVDAAARFHERIAGPVMMRNTLPPLASNDLLGGD